MLRHHAESSASLLIRCRLQVEFLVKLVPSVSLALVGLCTSRQQLLADVKQPISLQNWKPSLRTAVSKSLSCEHTYGRNAAKFSQEYTAATSWANDGQSAVPWIGAC